MKEVRNCTTGVVISETDFRKKHPNISFALQILKEDLLKYGYEQVMETKKPVTNSNQILVNNGTKKDDQGNWIYDWKVTNIPDNIIKEKLKAKQDEAWRRIQVERDRVNLGGVLVSGKWFHTDNESITNYLSLMVAGDNIPANIMWKTMDGSKVLMTSSIVKDIYNSCIVSKLKIFNHGEVLKELMLKNNNPDTFDATLGWPQVFSK